MMMKSHLPSFPARIEPLIIEDTDRKEWNAFCVEGGVPFWHLPRYPVERLSEGRDLVET